MPCIRPGRLVDNSTAYYGCYIFKIPSIENWRPFPCAQELGAVGFIGVHTGLRPFRRQYLLREEPYRKMRLRIPAR